MNKAIAIVAAAAAVTAAPQLMFAKQNLNLSSDLDMTLPGGDLFLAWSKKFGKTYSQDQESDKLATFKSNAALINSHNAQYEKGLQSYTMALNQFSDLSSAEFKATHLSQHKPTRARKEAFLDTSNLSASADWRPKGAVTPIKNQGQCGSCWAFSTTGSTEGAWQIAGNKLTSLSEQQLMDCSDPEGDKSCQGGFFDYGFEYIEKNGGIGGEAGYPYTSPPHNEACQHAKEADIVSRLKSFHDVPAGNEAQLQAAIDQVGPVSVAIDANNQAFQLYKSGIYSGPCGTQLDHAVLVVGYSPDYWIVKNSWGTTWGDAGYIKMSRAGNLCGIQNAASYPIAEKGPVPPSPAPGPAPPTPPAGKYTSIVQSIYKGLKKCNGTPQSTTIAIGKCVNDGNGAFKMTCSADGTKFTQTQYSDTACTTQTRVVPGPAATCLNAGPLTYLEFTCKTAADNVEIAQN